MESNSKQQLLVEYLVSSPDTFALCRGIVKSEYFDPSLRQTVAFIHQYYDKYSNVPTPPQIHAETGVSISLHSVTRDQVAYCSEEIEKFCRRRAVQQAILSAPKLIAEDNYATVEEAIKDAVGISLTKSLGLDYFANPQQRLEDQMKTPSRVSTGWYAVDEVMGGGLARRELLLLSANSGGGKSITLANLAMNFLLTPKAPNTDQKMDVLYISLELSEELIAQRFDTMYTGVSSVIWQQKYKEIAETVSSIGKHTGRLRIVRMPSGTNTNQIRAYLKEFELVEGYTPDLLIVDYLDIMGSNEHISADNVFEKDKAASTQLTDLLAEYNMFGATASQQNRSAIDAQELNQGHIAGGISKVNTCDWYVSIVLTPTMRSAGEIMFVFLKTRSSGGVGQTVLLKWDGARLRISNMPKDEIIQDDGLILPKSKQKGSGKSNKELTLLDSFMIDSDQ